MNENLLNKTQGKKKKNTLWAQKRKIIKIGIYYSQSYEKLSQIKQFNAKQKEKK